MLESYEEGQQLHVDDFIDDYYMPEGEYEYCEVESIDDDTVELVYYGIDGEERMTFTRAEMEHMLGWDLTEDEDRLESRVEDDETEPAPEEYGFF